MAPAGSHNFSYQGELWHQNILLANGNTNFFDSSLSTYSEAIRKTMMHEIGHGVGLDHPDAPDYPGDPASVTNCYNQNHQESVMNFSCGVNDQGPPCCLMENVAEAVTSCDASAARNNQVNSEACSYSCIVDPNVYYQCENASDFNYFNFQACDCLTTCEPDPQEVFECEHQEDYWWWDYDTCQCTQGASPILIDLDGDELDLTSAVRGVRFDIHGNGRPIQIGWTTGAARDAFLVLDRNSNGSVDDGSELFGNATSQPAPDPGTHPNGFEALAVFDDADNGGNDDGVITRADAVFSSLQLWLDVDHNGRSSNRELFTLAEMGVTELALQYQLRVRRDQFGNTLKYWSSVLISPDRSEEGAAVRRRAVDVYFAVMPKR